MKNYLCEYRYTSESALGQGVPAPESNLGMVYLWLLSING